MKNFFVLTTDESLHPENNFGNNIDRSTTDVSSCENPTNEMKDRARDKTIFFITSNFSISEMGFSYNYLSNPPSYNIRLIDCLIHLLDKVLL